MLEPRDESLMRKKKVIEIIKTFQEEQPEVKAGAKDNFGEQFHRIEKICEEEKREKSPSIPQFLDDFKDPL